MSDIPAVPGIYKITCIANGRFYIGSSVNMRERWDEHQSTLRQNKHRNPKLQRAWDKYGEQAFICDVWEFVLVPELLTAQEQYWLDKLKPFGGKGFNIARDASNPMLGRKHSLETREKQSRAHLGKPKSPEHAKKMGLTKIGNKNTLGRNHTLEECEKMSLSHLGKPLSLEHREKLSQAGKGKKKPSTYVDKLKGNKRALGNKFSDEARKKQSQSLLGNKNALGLKHSDETKAKISQAIKGKPKSLETRERMKLAWIKRRMQTG